MPRFVHDLGRSIKFGIEVGHGLHDLGGGDQRTLLAVHELRDLRGLQVMARLAPLLPGHPAPDIGAEYWDDAVVEHHRVLGVEIERPVDPFGGVPLLLLALVVELQQRRARIVVFPSETGLALTVELPFCLLDRQRIAIHRRHRAPLPRTATQYAAASHAFKASLASHRSDRWAHILPANMGARWPTGLTFALCCSIR